LCFSILIKNQIYNILKVVDFLVQNMKSSTHKGSDTQRDLASYLYRIWSTSQNIAISLQAMGCVLLDENSVIG